MGTWLHHQCAAPPADNQPGKLFWEAPYSVHKEEWPTALTLSMTRYNFQDLKVKTNSTQKWCFPKSWVASQKYWYEKKTLPSPKSEPKILGWKDIMLQQSKCLPTNVYMINKQKTLKTRASCLDNVWIYPSSHN